MNNNELLKLAHTKPLTDERVRVAAAYWLDASPHERTEADGVILARYARQAMEEIHVLRQQSADLLEAWVWVDEIRDGEPAMEEWEEASAFRAVEDRARTILDRYKDAPAPEELIGCPVCGQYPDDLPSCDYCKGRGIVPRSKGYEGEDEQP